MCHLMYNNIIKIIQPLFVKFSVKVKDFIKRFGEVQWLGV